MTTLLRTSEAFLRTASVRFVRPLYDVIAWDNPLNVLLGTRGVGKTTLLLQRLKRLQLPAREALYIDLGDVYFAENRLIDFIRAFVEGGGRYLFVDEVHRYGYNTWAQELKQAYDLYRGQLKITFTGSSAIQILRQKADLSRRALQFRIPGLSFREYLALKHGVELPVLDVTTILNDHERLSRELLTDDIRPVALLRDYWREGYYPIFLSEPEGYQSRLNTVVQLVLESDIPHVLESGRADYQALGRLLYAVSSSAPFKPNVSKIASRLSIGRNTVVQYLDLLERADLILTLRQSAKGTASLGKPDKIFLNNPNLMHALAPGQTNVGTEREVFFLNQLSYLTYRSEIPQPTLTLPPKGDFLFSRRGQDYLFEVGGGGKTLAQIGKAANHYAVIDSEASGSADRIPLWLFGLLY